jgi:hypothetical protein
LSTDGSSSQKKGPFAGIQRFLEETVDDSMGNDDDESLDESLPERDGDLTTPNNRPFFRIRRFLEQDSGILQKPSVSSFSPQMPPISSYAYCNEAFHRLNQKNAPSSPAVSAEPDAGETPKAYCSIALNEKTLDARETRKPYCNQAFLNLNEKKSSAAFTMPKLFSGNR